MDEKDKTKTEDKKSEEPVSDADKRDKSDADEKVKQLNADTERINQAIAENENAKARKALGGMSEAGQTSVKKEETNEEYADRFAKGEVNPLV